MTFTAIDAAELTLAILHYTQNLATMTKTAHKTTKNNNWLLITTQANLKAHAKEVARLQEQLTKKSPNSEETLTP